MEIGEHLRFQEIEDVFGNFKVCPKCSSKEGFWLGIKRDKPYVHCKSCGAIYELYEIYMVNKEAKTSKRLMFFRK